MKRLFLVLLGLAGAAQAQPARLQKQVLLPSQAVKAQWREHAFVPLQASDFKSGTVKQYQFSANQAHWAVLADFNGDGKKDLLVDGHSGKNFLRVAFLSPAYRYQVVDKGVWAGGGRTAYVEHIPPGVHDMPIADQKRLELKRDAYCEVYPEKAAILRYWKNGKFQEYYLAD